VDSTKTESIWWLTASEGTINIQLCLIRAADGLAQQQHVGLNQHDLCQYFNQFSV